MDNPEGTKVRTRTHSTKAVEGEVLKSQFHPNIVLAPNWVFQSNKLPINRCLHSHELDFALWSRARISDGVLRRINP
jgi:hypothetical protein